MCAATLDLFRLMVGGGDGTWACYGRQPSTMGPVYQLARPTHTHEMNMKWLAGNVIGNCEHCARFGIRSKLQRSDVSSLLLLAVWLQRRSFAINGTFSSGINL